MKILVLAGGLSSERNVSFSSGTMICNALNDLGHQAALVDLFLGLEDYPHPVDQIFKHPPALPSLAISAVAPDLAAVQASRRDSSPSLFGTGVLAACQLADVVFLGLHGTCGEDGRVQATFDLMGIPYTGSGYLGSAIAMDKDFTKRLARAEGILTPAWDFVTVTHDNLPHLTDNTPRPCVVKVPHGGSSIGVTICHSQQELGDTLTLAMGEQLVVEDYVAGREFSCGVLDGESLPPIEIIPREGFYNYANKYQVGATVEVCPAPLTGTQESKMRSAAKRVHHMLGLSAYSRSDFIMNDQGDIYFLEVNTLPGMTPMSLLPQEAAAVGVTYPQLCQQLIDIALRERGQSPWKP